jgi:isopentenyl-diphosphate delta-isomerase
MPWDDIHFIHKALPEINKEDINTSVRFFGKKFSAPILIAPMSGGYSKGGLINKNLAEAAADLNIGLCVGSQRPILVNKELARTYSVVKDYEIPLVIGNIGAPQLIRQKDKKPLNISDVKKLMDMINADMMMIHLNFLQETVQPEGDTRGKGVLEAIERVASEVPVIVKECGTGISKEVAKMLKSAGVKAIDVSGVSGTSWSAVESYRAESRNDRIKQRLGKTFWNWGIPSPVSILEANVGLPLIASGGIRNGLDVARGIILGAECAGIGRELLKHAVKSSNDVAKEIETVIEELKNAMFLVGAEKIENLKKKEFVITGKTREWIKSRVIRKT